MALVDLGGSAHFVVRYDEALGEGARARAQAVLDTAERDLARVAFYLPYARGGGDDPYRDDHRIVVAVVDLVTNRGGADNSATGDAARPFHTIRIGAVNGAGGPISDDFARFLFVAELAEVLMAAYGWVPNDSRGEALSRVMAEEFYPAAAYGEGNAPWVNGWLNTALRDVQYLGTPETTDVDPQSYGVGILYLNYLRSQLGHGLGDVCGAGGTELADAYRELTHQPGTDGTTGFRDLLEQFYPAGKPVALLTNNPFPLYGPAQRSVDVAVRQSVVGGLGALLDDGSVHVGGTVHIAPFFNCPARDYRYTVDRRPRQLDLVVGTVGFAQPQFRWTVNGVALPQANGSETVDATTCYDVPAQPGAPTAATEPFSFTYGDADEFSWQGLSHRLVLRNVTRYGHVQLTFTVSVTDAAGPADATTATVSTIVDASSVVYEQAYYDDRERCAREVRDTVEAHNRGLAQQLDRVSTLPDPPPPDVAAALLGALAQVRRELDAGQTDPEVAMAAARLLAGQLGVPEATVTGLLGMAG